jgi:hypothetical protein
LVGVVEAVATAMSVSHITNGAMVNGTTTTLHHEETTNQYEATPSTKIRKRR